VFQPWPIYLSQNLTRFVQRPNQLTTGSKRKLGSDDATTDAQLHGKLVDQLRSRLRCQKHHAYCLLQGSDLKAKKHKELDDIALSYWARMIVGGNGTSIMTIIADQWLGRTVGYVGSPAEPNDFRLP
jgi:hypothetical protein